MADIQLGVDIPGATAESSDEMKELRRRTAESQKQLELHRASIDAVRKRQEEQQTSIHRMTELLREMHPTIQSLKNLAAILRQVPSFPMSSRARQQRMAG